MDAGELKKELKRLKWTHKQLAERLGVRKITVDMWCTGARTISLEAEEVIRSAKNLVKILVDQEDGVLVVKITLRNAQGDLVDEKILKTEIERTDIKSVNRFVAELYKLYDTREIQ